MDDQNKNPVNPPLNPLPDPGQTNIPGSPTDQTAPQNPTSVNQPVPDVAFPSEDSGSLPLTPDLNQPTGDGTAAPIETPATLPPSKPKLSLGKGKIVATILGILLLVGGVGAGIVLVKQQQDIREKAATLSCKGDCTCYRNTDMSPKDGECGGSSCTCQCNPGYTAQTGRYNSCQPAESCTSPAGCVNNYSCPASVGTDLGQRDCAPNYTCCQPKSITPPSGGGGTCGSSGATQCKDSKTLQVCTGGFWGNDSTCPNDCTSTGCPAGQGGCCKSGTTSGCIADNQCLDVSLGKSCCSGSYTDSTCPTSNTRCGSKPTTTTDCICSLAGGSSCPPGQNCVVGGCTPSGSINGLCKTTSGGVTTPSSCKTGTPPYSCDTGGCRITNSSSGCYVNRYRCLTRKPEGCSDILVDSAVQNAIFKENCGTEQIDVYCPGWGSQCGDSPKAYADYKSNPYGSDCSTGGGPSAQCQAIKVYDTSWTQLTTAQLSALTVGTTIRLAVSGTATTGTIDKAQFTVNGVALPETTTKKPSSNEFYSEYVIPTTVTSFTITAKIHHSTLGWF